MSSKRRYSHDDVTRNNNQSVGTSLAQWCDVEKPPQIPPLSLHVSLFYPVPWLVLQAAYVLRQ